MARAGSGSPLAPWSPSAGFAGQSTDGGPLVDCGAQRRDGDHPLAALAPWLRPGVTDILVNGEAGLWVGTGDGLHRDPSWAATEAEVRALGVALVSAGGRHVDEATPCADVSFDGIRVHVVLPPLSSATLISIRVPGPSLALADLGVETEPLTRAIRDRRSLLITGATGSGKTTLLAALLAEVPPTERIVVVEDVAELRVRHPHVVAMQARQANLEGAGAIGLDRLVREALRMRPDRIVVGECRGAEVRELFTALNTGHAGAGTLHANSLYDVPARIEALGALAGLDAMATARQAASAIDLVVHVGRLGARRVLALGRLLVRDRLEIEPL